MSISEFLHSQTDLTVPGRGLQVAIERHYREFTTAYRLNRFQSDPVTDTDLSPMGAGWSHSFQWYILRDTVTNGTGAEPTSKLVLFTPNGRMEKFEADPSPPTDVDFNNDGIDDERFWRRQYDGWITWFGGTWSSTSTTEDFCTYVDGENTTYRFERFGDEAYIPLEYDAVYRLVSITDRNGNTITINYLDFVGTALADRTAQIDSIVDPLGRSFVFSYHTTPGHTHLISSIEDTSTGRTVSYDYDFDDGSGGPIIDPLVNTQRFELTSVSLPAVDSTGPYSGLPAEHARFPSGRTWEYAYNDLAASGATPGMRFMESITNPNGDLFVKNQYAHIDPFVHGTVPLNYYISKQWYGGDIASGNAPSFDYVYLNAGQVHPSDPVASDVDYVVYVNNRRGRVVRLEYDSDHPEVVDPNATLASVLVNRREYAGFAPDASSPSGVIDFNNFTQTNMPPASSKLRPSDPDYIDYGFEWNSDWQAAGGNNPEGNAVRTTYYGDTATTFDPVKKSAVIKQEIIESPGTANESIITEEWEYNFSFGGGSGGCCGGSDFATKHIDGRGNETTYAYDPDGNLLTTTFAAVGGSTATETFTYNTHGQVTSQTSPAFAIDTNAAAEFYSEGSATRTDTMVYGTAGNSFGYLVSNTIDSGGENLTTTYEYDVAGNVSKISEPDGDYTVFVYNQADQLVRTQRFSAVDSLLAQTDHYYDANGNVVRTDVANLVPSPAGGPNDFTVDTSNPTFTTIYEYDELDFLVREAREVGVSVPADIVGLGDGSGRFYASGLRADPDWIVTEYEYDDGKYLTKIITPEAVNGNDPTNVITRQYDARGFLFRETVGAGSADEVVTEHDYDDHGRLITKTVNPSASNARVWAYTYDGFDRLESETDPMGNVTTYTYDAAHNVVQVDVHGELNDASGSTGNVLLERTTMVYDARNRLERRDEWIFDPSNPATISSSSTAVYEWEYAADGSVIRETVPSGVGQVTTLTLRDTAGRVVTVVDPKTNITAYEYDTGSDVVATIQVNKSDAFGSGAWQQYVTSYAHDALGRVSLVIEGDFTGGPGNETEFRYDSRGNVVQRTDPRNNVAFMAYDGLSRLLETSRRMTVTGDGSTTALAPNAFIDTRIEYDANSRVTARIDDNGNRTEYEYDALDRQTVRRMADGTQDTFTYNAFGDVATVADANGTVVTFTHDDLGRETGKTITRGPGVLGSTMEAFAYDGLGRVVSAANNETLVTRDYDSRSNLLLESTVLANDAFGIPITDPGTGVAYSYDAARNLTVYQTSFGATVTRSVGMSHDALDQVQVINDDPFGTPALIASFAYVGPGRVERRAMGNGSVTTYGYNGYMGAAPPIAGDAGVGRVVSITHTHPGSGTTIDARAFAWDAAGNKTNHNDVRAWPTPPPSYARHRTFSYDSADRLVTSAYTYPDPGSAHMNGSLTYDLDGVHNRSAVTSAGALPRTEMQPGFSDTFGTGLSSPGNTYLLDSAVPDDVVNQYTETPSREYLYDDNGNMIVIGDRCEGDIDGDYTVGSSDLLILLGAWGSEIGDPDPQAPPYDPRADLDDDGLVGTNDNLILLSAYNSTCQNRRLEYDYRNQLVAFEVWDGSPSGTGALLAESRYTYDAFNRRVRKTHDSDGDGVLDPATPGDEATRFVYGGTWNWQLLAEHDEIVPGVTTLAKTHVYGAYIDEILTTEDSTVTGAPASYFFYQDDQYSIVAATNADPGVGHAVLERYVYSDYGEVLITDAAGAPQTGSAIGNRHTYLGQHLDRETGLYNFRDRFLSPTAGRFVQSDTDRGWDEDDPLGLGNGFQFGGSAPFEPWEYDGPMSILPFAVGAAKVVYWGYKAYRAAKKAKKVAHLCRKATRFARDALSRAKTATRKWQRQREYNQAKRAVKRDNRRGHPGRAWSRPNKNSEYRYGREWRKYFRDRANPSKRDKAKKPKQSKDKGTPNKNNRSLRRDQSDHNAPGDPIGPHHDYTDSYKEVWRIFPDGRMIPKVLVK